MMLLDNLTAKYKIQP